MAALLSMLVKARVKSFQNVNFGNSRKAEQRFRLRPSELNGVVQSACLRFEADDTRQPPPQDLRPLVTELRLASVTTAALSLSSPMGLGIKRCWSEAAAPPSKRTCGSGNSLFDLSLGCADLDLMQRTDMFLRQLGVSVGGQAPENPAFHVYTGLDGAVASGSSWQGVSEQDWIACAELNAVLHCFKHKLGEIPLESCHSFTRAAKAVTYNRLQQHMAQCNQPGVALQLSMTAQLLNTVACEQPEAAICKYTFLLHYSCPQWLNSWCTKWGFTGERVTLLALDMYPQSVPHLAGYDLLGYPIHRDMSGCSPVMTLYVPCV